MKEAKMKILRLPLEHPVTLEDGVTYDKVPLPEYATDGAAGFDLYSANVHEVTIEPHETGKIPLGIKVAVMLGYKLSIKCRSGLSTKGINVGNSPGVIDSDYRGEVIAVIHNHTHTPFTVTPLMRVCQGEIEEAPQYGFVEAANEDELGNTARGEGGLGSTGNGIISHQ